MENGSSRREFLRKAGLMAGGLAALQALDVGRWLTASHAAAATQTAPKLGGFYIELDGVGLGPIISAEGGLKGAEMAADTTGASQVLQYTPAKIRYDFLTVKFYASTAAASLYQWMSKNFAGASGSKRNGAVVALDGSGNIQSRLIFYNAFIKEVAFSSLVASGADPFLVTLTIVPETTELTGGGGKGASGGRTTEKPGGYYRIMIPGLETVCQSVTRININPLKCAVSDASTGQTLYGAWNQGPFDPPSFAITFPESAAAQMFAWQGSYHQGLDARKSGEVGLVGKAGTDLVKISFSNLLPIKLTRVVSTQPAHSLMIRAELRGGMTEII